MLIKCISDLNLYDPKLGKYIVIKSGSMLAITTWEYHSVFDDELSILEESSESLVEEIDICWNNKPYVVCRKEWVEKVNVLFSGFEVMMSDK